METQPQHIESRNNPEKKINHEYNFEMQNYDTLTV